MNRNDEMYVPNAALVAADDDIAPAEETEAVEKPSTKSRSLYDVKEIKRLYSEFIKLQDKTDKASVMRRNIVEEEFVYQIDGMTQAILTSRKNTPLKPAYKHWLASHSEIDTETGGISKHPLVTIAADVLQESRFIIFREIIPTYNAKYSQETGFVTYAWNGLCIYLRRYFDSCLELSNGGYNEHGAFTGSTKSHSKAFRIMAHTLSNWRTMGYSSPPTALQFYYMFKDIYKYVTKTHSPLTLDKVVEMYDVITSTSVSLDAPLDTGETDSDTVSSVIPVQHSSGVEYRVEKQAEEDELHDMLRKSIADALSDLQQVAMVLSFELDFEDMLRYIKNNRYFVVLVRYFVESEKNKGVLTLNHALTEYILTRGKAKGKQKEYATLKRQPRDGEIAEFIMEAITFCKENDKFSELDARAIKVNREEAIHQLKNYEPLVNYVLGVKDSKMLSGNHASMERTEFDWDKFFEQALMDARIADEIPADEI